LAAGQKQEEALREVAEEAEGLLLEIGDTGGQAELKRILCFAAHGRGDYTAAAPLGRQSLPPFQQGGNEAGKGLGLLSRSPAISQWGGEGEARTLCEESLQLSRRLGNAMGIAEALHTLCVLAQRQGELARGWSLIAESLAIQRRLGRRPAI